MAKTVKTIASPINYFYQNIYSVLNGIGVDKTTDNDSDIFETIIFVKTFDNRKYLVVHFGEEISDDNLVLRISLDDIYELEQKYDPVVYSADKFWCVVKLTGGKYGVMTRSKLGQVWTMIMQSNSSEQAQKHMKVFSDNSVAQTRNNLIKIYADFEWDNMPISMPPIF